MLRHPNSAAEASTHQRLRCKTSSWCSTVNLKLCGGWFYRLAVWRVMNWLMNISVWGTDRNNPEGCGEETAISVWVSSINQCCFLLSRRKLRHSSLVYFDKLLHEVNKFVLYSVTLLSTQMMWPRSEIKLTERTELNSTEGKKQRKASVAVLLFLKKVWGHFNNNFRSKQTDWHDLKVEVRRGGKLKVGGVCAHQLKCKST